MVYGSVSFIKEDKILSSPDFCKIENKLPPIMKFLNEYYELTNIKVICAVCINSDMPYVLERVKKVYELCGNTIYVNFWNEIGIYKTIRDLELPFFIHYQTSGIHILTDKSNRFQLILILYMILLDFQVQISFIQVCYLDIQNTMKKK